MLQATGKLAVTNVLNVGGSLNTYYIILKEVGNKLPTFVLCPVLITIIKRLLLGIFTLF